MVLIERPRTFLVFVMSEPGYGLDGGNVQTTKNFDKNNNNHYI